MRSSQPELARMIANQYNGRLAILNDRILRHRKISRATPSGISLNVPARSMKGVLMLFAAQQPFARNTESFYNPKITKVEVTIEGIPNQLFSQGMRAYQMLNEASKLFAPGRTRPPPPPPRGGSGGERPWSLSGSSWPPSSLCGLTSGQPMMTGFMAVATA